MKELQKETSKGEYVELIFNTDKKIIGKIPFDFINNEHIVFLPEENFNKFYSKIKGNSFVFDDIRGDILFIHFSQIKSYEIKRNELSFIQTENSKPLPNWFNIQVRNTGKLGYINIRYGLPNHDKIFDLGLLKIIDGGVTLPITFVFLSYAKEDKEIVKSTMETLHNYGVITWFDEKDLLPGDDWQDKIETSIEKADYVFIFFSSNSIDRQGYKNKEIRFALDQKMLKPFNSRYIIPILIDDVKPPRELNQIHWISIKDEDWIQKVLMSIGKDPNKKYWL